jgi:Spy/CpxP family protein refolding chaperone
MLNGGIMIRTQIQLTEEQAQKLRELSAAGRESMAALIRKAVDQFLVSGISDRSALYRQAESVVGKYTSETSDISIHHDRYLGEAFES